MLTPLGKESHGVMSGEEDGLCNTVLTDNEGGLLTFEFSSTVSDSFTGMNL